MIRLLIAAAAVLAAAACGAPTGAAGPVPPAPSPAAGGGTDAAWIQLMIPMNEQALALLDLVPGRTSDGRIDDLARRIAPARHTELADLRRLRERAGLPTTDQHEGHDLPGLVLPAELATMEALRGNAFDRAVLDTLREQLEQGARLCAAERASGADPDTRDLATRMEDTRRTELTWLPACPGCS